MILIQMPDAKFCRSLTVGQDYPFIRQIGNGVVIQDNDQNQLIVLRSRFEP